MPPSGYNYAQSSAICEFLRSCVEALVMENRGLRTAPKSVQKEIASIERDNLTVERPLFEKHLLGITLAFYRALLENCPEDLDEILDHADSILGEFSQRVLDIHVDDRVIEQA
ncbi:MAG: hypothetical protein IPK32_21695 [Verrucomicrobiaceae bacterium]|nr:hypothetical protein [Verrucomicrobiaceae bacterium]